MNVGSLTERLRNLWRRRPPWPFSRRATLLGAVGLLLVLGVLWERCGVRGCPNVDRLKAYQPGGASVLLDRRGRPFANLAPVARQVVRLGALPRHVPAAFLAVEDKRFFGHDGVDWRRVAGAVLANVQAGGVSQGFSTITMQLARNVFPERLPGQRRTLRRKLLEIRVAREIESRFTKAEILELYLNHVYFGAGVYGIEAASRHYFGRKAASLSVSDAALLAALLKGPARYDPRRHPERARTRRNVVLALMAEQGAVTPAQAAAARGARLAVTREPPRQRNGGLPAPYFVEVVRRQLEERFGDAIYTSPLRIHTTLDANVQAAAEAELLRQLRAIERGDFGRVRAAARPAGATGSSAVQGAVVVLDPATGDVLAEVGGRDFRGSRFDRALQARRQPGSAFKPFVFAAALAGGYVGSQHIADEPLSVRLASGEVWQPGNFTGIHEGSVSLREALVRSINVPTVRLASAVGTGRVARLAKDAGVRSPIPEHPSMPLGTGELSPLELASAYTAFAGSGRAVPPRFVRLVETRDRKVLWEAKQVEPKEVLDPRVAFIVTDMLRDAVDRGTGVGVRRAGFHGPAAGKTGTTNDATDAWFAGYTPDLLAVVWIGFDYPRPITRQATGGRLAAPVWGRMMRRIYQSRPMPSDWTAPEGVVELPVDPASGLVLAEGCVPTYGSPAREVFIEGTEPATVCPREEHGPSFFRRLFTWAGDVFDRVEDSVDERDIDERERRRERALGERRLPRDPEDARDFVEDILRDVREGRRVQIRSEDWREEWEERWEQIERQLEREAEELRREGRRGRGRGARAP